MEMVVSKSFCKCNKNVIFTILTYNIIRRIILLARQYYNLIKNVQAFANMFLYQRETHLFERKRAETGDKKMVFNTGAALLDAIVLAVVSVEAQGTYGYRITQDVRQVLDVSESTLYPVLRRLQKEAFLEVYDKEFGGRNRRYYKVTEAGRDKLLEYCRAWEEYSSKISKIFTEVER